MKPDRLIPDDAYAPAWSGHGGAYPPASSLAQNDPVVAEAIAEGLMVLPPENGLPPMLRRTSRSPEPAPPAPAEIAVQEEPPPAPVQAFGRQPDALSFEPADREPADRAPAECTQEDFTQEACAQEEWVPQAIEQRPAARVTPHPAAVRSRATPLPIQAVAEPVYRQPRAADGSLRPTQDVTASSRAGASEPESARRLQAVEAPRSGARPAPRPPSLRVIQQMLDEACNQPGEQDDMRRSSEEAGAERAQDMGDYRIANVASAPDQPGDIAVAHAPARHAPAGASVPPASSSAPAPSICPQSASPAGQSAGVDANALAMAFAQAYAQAYGQRAMEQDPPRSDTRPDHVHAGAPGGYAPAQSYAPAPPPHPAWTNAAHPAAQAYSPAGQYPGYHPAPQPYGYAPPPHGYAQQPYGYAPPPHGYVPHPHGYAPHPNGYAPHPHGYAQPVPAQYAVPSPQMTQGGTLAPAHANAAMLESLLQYLPRPGSAWSEADRAKWLQAVSQMFDIVYGETRRAG